MARPEQPPIGGRPPLGPGPAQPSRTCSGPSTAIFSAGIGTPAPLLPALKMAAALLPLLAPRAPGVMASLPLSAVPTASP